MSAETEGEIDLGFVKCAVTNDERWWPREGNREKGNAI